MAVLCDTEQLDGGLATVKGALFCFDLLEGEGISSGLEVDNWRTFPCLISFRVVLFEVGDVL